MSKKYIGDVIDIHAGGEDLIFPHHENEIAQSEAANDAEFARYWMHNGFLKINNEKMSKSLGNFFTVREISEKYDLQIIRFFMLSAHYRSPLNFSDDLVEAAKSSLERIKTSVSKLDEIINAAKAEKADDAEAALISGLDGFEKKFDDAMEDDLNTADAISAIFELVKFANTNVNENSSREFATKVYDMIVKLCDVLGIKAKTEAELLDADIEKLIQERQDARKNKDFARADEIRNSLLEKGIILEDTREGVRWKRA